MTPVLEQLQVDLNRDLERIAARFKPGAKLTIVVRNPLVAGDSSVVLTDDDLELAIGEIRKLQSERTRAAAELAGKAPTPIQLATLEYMQEFICRRAMPPTVRELSQHFAVGPQAIIDRLRALKAKGLVVHVPRVQRGWRPA